MRAFDEAFKWMIPHEGGSKFTDDPDDPGGKTKWGISQRAYPDIEIQSLTEDEAKGIYRSDYWDTINGEAIANVNWQIAAKVFDAGVNLGPGKACRMLQSSLNDLGSGIAVDGRIGQGTLAALSQHDPQSVMSAFTTRLRNFYLSLNKPKYERGWLKRAASIPPEK